MSGGGGGGGPKGKTDSKTGTRVVVEKTGGVKDLVVKKESESKLRYPDKKVKKKKTVRKKKKKEPEKLISVVRKERKRNLKKENNISISRKNEQNILKTGISSGTGPGTGSGSGSGYGSGTGSGLQSSPYAYYFETLRNKISSSWYSSLISPGLRGKFISTVYFKIYRDGSIRDLKLEKSSGIESLDLSALRAVENAHPFSPLPSDFPYQYLIVHFDFEWEK